MTSRDIGDISTNPGGLSGAVWTQRAKDSVAALWDLHGGLLLDVAGVNTLSAAIAVDDGFTAYSDGFKAAFVPATTNTGAATINIGGVGPKAIRDPNGDVLQAGAMVGGRLTEIVFVSADDHFRLVTAGGTTNVTVEGGIIVQRSAPSRLAASAGPATAATTVGLVVFQCTYPDSRVILEGNVSKVTGAGAAAPEGTIIALFVDGVSVQSFTDHCQPNAQASTPFYFSHLPGNTDSHTYEVRASSTISATYPKGSNVIWASEMSPNA